MAGKTLLEIGDNVLDLWMRGAVRFDDLQTSLALAFERGGKRWGKVMIEQLSHLTTKEIPFAVRHATADGEGIVDSLKTEIVAPRQTHRLNGCNPV